MEIAGTVVDAVTGSPLVKATITADGSPVGVTDATGQFDLQLSTSPSLMTFSYVGYEDITMTPGQANNANQISMTPVPQTLPAVTVTPSIAKANFSPLVVAGVGLGVLLLLGKGKKKVAGVDSTTILLIAGAGVAAYLLYAKSQANANAAAVAAQAAKMQTTVYNPYGAASGGSTNNVATDINAGSGAVSALSNFVNTL